MIKLHKSRKGFTLIEMVLVIAIVVILAFVIVFSVHEYLDKAKSATSKMNEGKSIVESVTMDIDAAI
ncbi:MAG: type II secretion system protein [Clostridiales bacterium]|nr:type II secretion system protein [Clostridiales bacterium]